MLKAAQILNIPILATTQQSSKLGPACPELNLDTPSGYATAVHSDKTLFSMLTPSVQKALSSITYPAQGQTTTSSQPLSCVILGIESHICVTQTTLDLLSKGHKVYILADGVSSCNKEEIPIALARLRAEGAIVTTSESWIYECMGDASIAEFRDIAKLVRETKEETSKSLEVLCKI
ncbi:Isochorismatase hydrolase [Venturia nashicola]|uniref:Isochorismatase hydrolase n=1 Tax=Venturia nashicola TaxID=86259 RepID=A0A4Z1NLW0_9PEZI|nr:Isochorismatase hydrolase [Venturia nashicola]TLD21591.1 Isochorismatase hydrolase [Venturia nashicola]